MAKKLFFALLLFALGGLEQPFLAAATGGGKSSSVNSGGSTSAKPASAALKQPGDAQIEQALRAKLAKSKMSADHFTVSVVKGVATIEGNTAVTQHKGAMTRMAKSCGAIAVHNNIHISEEAKAKTAQSLTKAGGANSATGKKPQPAVENTDVGAPAAVTIPRATVVRSTGSPQ